MIHYISDPIYSLRSTSQSAVRIGAMVMRKFLSLLPLLAAGSAAVDISVASSGGNSTGNNLQYGIMEEVCSVSLIVQGQLSNRD